MANKYSCFSIADMARIPEEALPRLLAELPDMIASVRPMVAMIDALKAEGAAKAASDVETFGKSEWIDDDKGMIHHSIIAKDARKTVLQAKWSVPLNREQA